MFPSLVFALWFIIDTVSLLSFVFCSSVCLCVWFLCRAQKLLDRVVDLFHDADTNRDGT